MTRNVTSNSRGDKGWREAMLREALQHLPDLERAARRSNPKKRYAYRAIQVMASDCCEAGSETAAWIDLDVETGRKLVKSLRGLIEAELNAIGRRRKRRGAPTCPPEPPRRRRKARRPTVGRTPGSGGVRGEGR